jgi:hypothetical protein
MYAALWRALPGGRLAKSLEALGVFLVVVAVLFVWVFPAVATRLPFENVTLEPSTAATASTSPTVPATTTGSP